MSTRIGDGMEKLANGLDQIGFGLDQVGLGLKFVGIAVALPLLFGVGIFGLNSFCQQEKANCWIQIAYGLFTAGAAGAAVTGIYLLVNK